MVELLENGVCEFGKLDLSEIVGCVEFGNGSVDCVGFFFMKDGIFNDKNEVV